MPQILQRLSHGVGSHKLSINPLELSHYSLIHQGPFATPIVIGNMHAEYHDPVAICKAMDSSTAGCSYKLGCTLVFQSLLIPKVKY